MSNCHWNLTFACALDVTHYISWNKMWVVRMTRWSLPIQSSGGMQLRSVWHQHCIPFIRCVLKQKDTVLVLSWWGEVIMTTATLQHCLMMPSSSSSTADRRHHIYLHSVWWLSNIVNCTAKSEEQMCNTVAASL